MISKLKEKLKLGQRETSPQRDSTTTKPTNASIRTTKTSGIAPGDRTSKVTSQTTRATKTLSTSKQATKPPATILPTKTIKSPTIKTRKTLEIKTQSTSKVYTVSQITSKPLLKSDQSSACDKRSKTEASRDTLRKTEGAKDILQKTETVKDTLQKTEAVKDTSPKIQGLASLVCDKTKTVKNKAVRIHLQEAVKHVHLSSEQTQDNRGEQISSLITLTHPVKRLHEPDTVTDKKHPTVRTRSFDRKGVLELFSVHDPCRNESEIGACKATQSVSPQKTVATDSGVTNEEGNSPGKTKAIAGSVASVKPLVSPRKRIVLHKSKDNIERVKVTPPLDTNGKDSRTRGSKVVEKTRIRITKIPSDSYTVLSNTKDNHVRTTNKKQINVPTQDKKHTIKTQKNGFTVTHRNVKNTTPDKKLTKKSPKPDRSIVSQDNKGRSLDKKRTEKQSKPEFTVTRESIQKLCHKIKGKNINLTQLQATKLTPQIKQARPLNEPPNAHPHASENSRQENLTDTEKSKVTKKSDEKQVVGKALPAVKEERSLFQTFQDIGGKIEFSPIKKAEASGTESHNTRRKSKKVVKEGFVYQPIGGARRRRRSSEVSSDTSAERTVKGLTFDDSSETESKGQSREYRKNYVHDQLREQGLLDCETKHTKGSKVPCELQLRDKTVLEKLAWKESETKQTKFELELRASQASDSSQDESELNVALEKERKLAYEAETDTEETLTAAKSQPTEGLPTSISRVELQQKALSEILAEKSSQKVTDIKEIHAKAETHLKEHQTTTTSQAEQQATSEILAEKSAQKETETKEQKNAKTKSHLKEDQKAKTCQVKQNQAETETKSKTKAIIKSESKATNPETNEKKQKADEVTHENDSLCLTKSNAQTKTESGNQTDRSKLKETEVKEGLLANEKGTQVVIVRRSEQRGKNSQERETNGQNDSDTETGAQKVNHLNEKSETKTESKIEERQLRKQRKRKDFTEFELPKHITRTYSKLHNIEKVAVRKTSTKQSCNETSTSAKEAKCQNVTETETESKTDFNQIEADTTEYEQKKSCTSEADEPEETETEGESEYTSSESNLKESNTDEALVKETETESEHALHGCELKDTSENEITSSEVDTSFDYPIDDDGTVVELGKESQNSVVQETETPELIKSELDGAKERQESNGTETESNVPSNKVESEATIDTGIADADSTTRK